MMKSPSDSATRDSDAPWKMILEQHFQDFMALCYPDIADRIDWRKKPISLDTELHKILKEGERGKRMADKLFQVYLKTGEASLIILHIEVQNQRDNDFAKRMYISRYRLGDRYNKPVVSLAILGDSNPQWRPCVYREEAMGCRIEMVFRITKLIDYQAQQDELLASRNPFAMVIVAHLAGIARYPDDQSKYKKKTQLTRLLYERGWQKRQVMNLYTFIDYMLTLPESLAIAYNNDVHQIEEEKQVAYITTAERIGIAKGLEQGLLQGLEKGFQQGIEKGLQQGIEKGHQEGRQEGELSLLMRLLQLKFKDVPEKYRQRITQADADTLLLWGERVLNASTLEDVFRND